MNKKILLVEDDPLIVKIYKTRLEEEGFEVEVVSQGERVVGELKKNEFDLVLLDIVLPELTGFEILKRIKGEGLLENLKVLVLSNLGEKRSVEKAAKLGAVSYLIKAHYTPTEVIEEVKKTLSEN